MRLIEILATVLNEWPAGTEYAAQDSCDEWKGRVWFTDNEFSDCVNGSWDIGDGNIENHINGLELSSDCNTSIVTRSQWARKRVKQRQLIREGYRIISQPQAEEIEVKDTTIGTLSYKVEIDTTEASQAIDELAAKWDQVDGPLLWRDTVNELDAYIEEFTRERDVLINRLALEGFALLPAMTAVMGVADVDMSDWRNWKTGDKIRMTARDWCDLTKGAIYEIVDTGDDFITIIDDVDYRRSLEVDDETMFEHGRLMDFEFVPTP